MHDNRVLIEQRLARALTRIQSACYAEHRALEVAIWAPVGEPVPVDEALRANFRPFRVGDAWGPPWGTAWFRLRGVVPPEWSGQCVEALVDLGFDTTRTGFHAEGLVYGADGQAIKGLNPQTQWVRVGDPVAGGEAVEWYVEAAANPMILGRGADAFRPTPLGDRDTAGDEPLYRLSRAALAVFRPDVWELVHDLEVLGQLAAELDLGDARGWQIRAAIDRALDAIDADAVSATAAAARAALADVLAAPARASAHRISAVGHAHIDSAWLWPIRETVRKVARTAANVVDLMDAHPEFVYAMSSAQQFAWLKDHHPAIYARVRQKVADGQFVPVGGMWVESDTNMPGGEALARQFAYGKRFFLDEFGVETTEVWLPDSFGYSAALPQLIALSGSRYFLSQKLSWNQTNRFPHHTFAWEGIDGTRIFTHFPPIDTYNSDLSGAQLAHAVRNFADKAGSSRSLAPFGYGDGGGGPTREMLARAARLADLDGSPRVAIESAVQFFRQAEADYPDLPVWAGELYLEKHRGTYTSQLRTKQGNRRCEHLLREAELWCATAAVRAGHPYPYDALDRLWKIVLLQQFHDILPGSSIAWVHREAVANYAAVASELEELIRGALASLGGTADDVVVFNAAPHEHNGVPAMGAGIARDADAGAVTVTTDDAGGFVLDNSLLRVALDARGLMTSIRDGDRQVLAPGAVGNLLQLHPDTPNAWDAWDIDPFYRHRARELTDGTVNPVPGGVRIDRKFGNSSISQEVTLSPGERRIDIDTDIDWHEREQLLKLCFDIDVAADRSAAEVQFGHVMRSTHTNTSWDAARFEICAHRWIHVADAGYGVAIVNDSTYGHDVTRRPRNGGGVTTVVRLSLIRAPRHPDPDADQGRHRVRCAVVPGAHTADAIREGYRINLPERRAPGATVAPLVSVDDDGTIVESVKLADDRSGAVIVRIYEGIGRHTTARVRIAFPFGRAQLVDLLERPMAETELLRATDNEITLRLRPFQIVTLRLS